MKNKREKTKKIALSREAERLFLICLPMILVDLIALFISFLSEYELYPQYAVSVYPAMFEYILMSLTILSCGGLLYDYVVKSYGK